MWSFDLVSYARSVASYFLTDYSVYNIALDCNAIGLFDTCSDR